MRFEIGKVYRVNIGYDKWAIFKVVPTSVVQGHNL